MTVGELREAIRTLNDDRIVTVGFPDKEGFWRIWPVTKAYPQTIIGNDCFEIVAYNPELPVGAQ